MPEKVVRFRERPKVRSDHRRGTRRSRPSAVEVLETLRQRIARQEVPPGSKLREHDLAEEFGVPRTRIREVFGTLESRGLIERIPNRGAVVMRLDFAHVFQLYDVREVLEGLCVRLATENAPPESWQDLVDHFRGPMAKYVRDGDFDAFIAGYERLRQRIIDAARNVVVAQMLDSIYEKTNVVIRRIIILPGRAEVGLREHQAVLAAMRRGDAGEAERLKRQNLEKRQGDLDALPQLCALSRAMGQNVSTELSRGPLTGMRILEMGSTVAGPFCGRLLADFGAEVIKIEPADGDPVRTMGKHFGGKSLYAASIFRNKRLISIDLHRSEGRDIARGIALSCDVVVENFKPGTLERWGLGWNDLSPSNPRLVMVRISGFGQDGPYASRPGYGVICEAVSGLRHLTGDPDRPPSRVAVSLTDYITGLHGAFGAVMALMARGTTGRGQYVDAALYECAFNFMEPWIPAFEKLGHIANRTGSRLAESTPNNLYPTGDGDFIHITAMADSLFRRLAEAMGKPELAEDLRFVKALERNRNSEVLDHIIAHWTTAHPLSEIERKLAVAGVPATRIYTIADIFKDPHYAARRSIVAAPDRDLGAIAMAAVVPRLSATPGEIRHAGRAIGEDTRAVLAALLGYDSDRISGLERSGVITCASAAS